MLDKGYDGQPMHDECESRGIRPVIALKETPAVKAGQHKPPSCDHGEWTFAGSDAKRGATKWRCPTGECQPASVWIKASRLHPLIPHGTERFKALYRQRTAVERGFGRLKHESGCSRCECGGAAGHAARQPDDPGATRLRAADHAGHVGPPDPQPAAGGASHHARTLKSGPGTPIGAIGAVLRPLDSKSAGQES